MSQDQQAYRIGLSSKIKAKAKRLFSVQSFEKAKGKICAIVQGQNQIGIKNHTHTKYRNYRFTQKANFSN